MAFRVISTPTGPTGNFKGVRIFANITGPSGIFSQGQQFNSQQMGTGMTGPVGGRYESVYPVGATAFAEAPAGTFKTVVIAGYTGPA